MGKRNPPLLEYTDANLEAVTTAILKNLTPDLLPKKWRETNKTNPLYGHCHTASGCLYRIFGSENLSLYRAVDPYGVYHWWCVDRAGRVIDLTAGQYEDGVAEELHRQGIRQPGMLGFDY
jgi:hypothetical protein